MSLDYFGHNLPHFFAIVEDRNDPLKLGRVRIRCFGIHDSDLTKIPVDKLPWAQVLLPPTSAGLNGIGQSPTGIIEGTTVFGVFLDQAMQQPLILGSLPGRPTQLPNTRSNQATDLEDLKAIYNNGIREDTGEPIEPLKEIERDPTLDINLLVLHCTATRASQDWGPEEVRRVHVLEKGWDDIGYHFLIQRNGATVNTRPVNIQGIHARGYNSKSVAICMVGGVDDNLKPQDNFTPAQWRALENIVGKYLEQYPGIKVIGHNQVSSKGCPSFDVQKWLAKTFPDGQVEDSQLEDLNDDVVEAIAGLKQLEESVDPGGSTEEIEGFVDDIADGRAIEPPVISQGTYGFQDPNGVYPRVDKIEEPDTNRLARSESTEKTVVESKLNGKETGIRRPASGTYDEPDTPYNAKYPLNHVLESESGHVIEVDDTPGAERIHEYHRTGTFKEIHPDGDKVTKINGNNFEITVKDNHVYVKGNAYVTVDGNAELFVGGNVDARIKGDFWGDVEGRMDLRVVGEIDIRSGTRIQLLAPRIDIN